MENKCIEDRTQLDESTRSAVAPLNGFHFEKKGANGEM